MKQLAATYSTRSLCTVLLCSLLLGYVLAQLLNSPPLEPAADRKQRAVEACWAKHVTCQGNLEGYKLKLILERRANQLSHAAVAVCSKGAVGG